MSEVGASRRRYWLERIDGIVAVTCYCKSALQSTTHSYYARREQWLPTRRLVAPRSLNDGLRPPYANNNPAQPALPLIDYGTPLETAGLDRKRRKSERS
jgi:hypothetical protein